MLAHLYAAFAPLKIGMDILVGEEGIKTDVMIAQGGLFRTPVIAQQILANMLNLPITLMETAGEGGSWGMAVLACFAKYGENKLLADFLDEVVLELTFFFLHGNGARLLHGLSFEADIFL